MTDLVEVNHGYYKVSVCNALMNHLYLLHTFYARHAWWGRGSGGGVSLCQDMLRVYCSTR